MARYLNGITPDRHVALTVLATWRRYSGRQARRVRTLISLGVYQFTRFKHCGVRHSGRAMSILVVEPDRDLCDLLGYLLRREHFQVVIAHDGADALRAWETENPELVLLDTALPGLDGWGVCQRLREQSSVPVIFLVAVADEEAIVRGLDLGADDYVTRPFSPRPLLARIRAVLRRARVQRHGPQRGSAPMQVGDLTVDPQSRTVERAGEAITLTPTQFKLLYELVLHEGQVLTQQVLTDRVWGYAAAADTTIVKGQIYNLRRKLEPDPANPVYIHTIPGAGYSFRRRPPHAEQP